MFKNSGKKIMGLVKFVFYFNMVIMILGVIGVTAYLMMEEGIEAGLLGLLGGVVVAIVYLLLVYVSLLCLFAFGELVQSSIDQRNLLQRMASMPPAAPARPVAPVRPVPPVTLERPAAPVVPERPVAPAAPVTPAPAAGDHTASCPHCGARQSAANNNCKYCGTPMR